MTAKTRSNLCWAVLACLVVPMFASYFFDDMFSTVSHIFNNPAQLDLGWNSDDYGKYTSDYSFLCIWGGLVICGVLLDVFGVRLVGSIFVSLMIFGAAMVFAALRSGLDPSRSLIIARIGCMLFGLGSEIAGVAVTRSIAKWFKGRNVALAMGLQLAIARLGTAAAFIISPMLIAEKTASETYSLSETSLPALVGLSLLLVGGVLWAVFVALDARRDKAAGVVPGKGSVSEEDKFRFKDILKVLGNKNFLYISLLCVTFYCCIVAFKKFASAIIIPRFDMDADSAKWMISMIPFFTVIFTPLFGALVDKVGHGTRWMIIGAVLVLAAHVTIAFAPQGHAPFGFVAIAMLGVGYSLVPSAMWPSVSKIVSASTLGTAFSLIYWVQNLGMWGAKRAVGSILESNGASGAQISEYVFIGLGTVAVAIALLLRLSSRNNPDMGLDAPAGK